MLTRFATLLLLAVPLAAGADEKPRHLLYVVTPGIRNLLEYGGAGILVFDRDHDFAFVKRIATPASAQQKPENVKGVCASATTKKLYFSTLTRLYCVDLVSEKTLWEKELPGGCDRMSMTPDGKVLYVPTLEKDHWNVVDGETGELIRRIETKSKSHNTVCSVDGSRMFMAGLGSPLLPVADTTTHEVVQKIGPFSAAIRPFTVNRTHVFVNVNGLLGFEIGDLKTGKMLHRVEVKDFEKGKVKRHGCPSHGIGLTPDEKEIWVCDAANTRLHVFDNTVSPPKQGVSIKLRDEPGWVTFSSDGKFAFPSTGEIIDVATKKIVAALKDEKGREVHSEKMVEIVFKGGVPTHAGDQFARGGQTSPVDHQAADGPEEIAKRLLPFFHPPGELANDLGKYRSPLLFDDGKPVRTAADWQKRRQEILKYWHGQMGEWPALIEKPKLEFLSKEQRETVTQHHIRLEVAPGKTTEDAYLLVPEGKGPFPAVVVVFYDAKSGIGQGKSAHCDFAWQLARRGFVALSLGSPPDSFYPNKETCQLQPLSYHAYVAANCYNALANLSNVDAKRIGVVGHSYGGKWAMFASCLFEKFACAAWSDPGIVFDEKRGNVNYWEPWYIGHDPATSRKAGIPNEKNPRTGPYKKMMEDGRDLHELHVLMAPRPFLVSGGSEDLAERWKPLNHAIAVNKMLGFEDRVAMTNRKGHTPTEESNEQLCQFFEYFLKHGKALEPAGKK